MFINKILLNNFRVYYGQKELEFSSDIGSNITLIAGNNGFGKTSFLTSLVWCLYGKLMVDVDEKYRLDIMDSGGYKRYCEKLMNRFALNESDEKISDLEASIKETSNTAAKMELKKQLAACTSFSVSLQFSGLMIPAVSCDFLEVKRTYDIKTHQEQVEILIDGKPNELTKGVGPEIFINDFILPKEISKFFFFDAEKIVSLAEINTAEEKRYLSQAYAEVLGIKKYTDLKSNLENLRLRLRNKSASRSDRALLEKLQKSFTQSRKLVDHCQLQIDERAEIILSKRVASDRYQESLIREGSSITVDELKRLRESQQQYSTDLQKTRTRFNELLELAPFAMLAGKMTAIKEQLEVELHNSAGSRDILQKRYDVLQNLIGSQREKLKFSRDQQHELSQIFEQAFFLEVDKNAKTLLDFTTDQQNHFLAIYDNLKNAYSKTFRQLIMEQKRLQSLLLNVQRKLADAESKEKDPVIMAIRQAKEKVDEELRALEAEVFAIQAKKQTIETDVQTYSRQISELSRRVSLEEADEEKDRVAERLIAKLDKFISDLKTKKKHTLEKGILRELNRLMHKDDFVSKVNVVLTGDLIDIELFDHQRAYIDKELLSKGEQQLYATALLKALVDESNVRFPVFIDSPLQKFDRQHSKNIIQEFYPFLSGQVVLFPLLQKELNELEYEWMLPKVGKTYLIEQHGKYNSGFKQVEPEDLFAQFHLSHSYVQ